MKGRRENKQIFITFAIKQRDEIFWVSVLITHITG